MADMSASEINAAPNGVENSGMHGSGCGLLVVVGEPFSDDHRELILEEITKGFKSWDDAAHGCDINAELAAVAAAAANGEEGPNGERIITHAADNLQTEVLLYPHAQTLMGRIRSLLSAPLRHKHIIYAGHALQGSGAWVLQDDTFTFSSMVQACRDPEVESGLTQNDCTLTIHCPGEGDWSTTALNTQCKNVKGAINPDDCLPELAGVVQFTAYLSSFVKCRDLGGLLQSSDVVGNIRFSKPTLYIFPGGEGDSSLFGISGFNLLVNGGFGRKACFWDFTRHLDRIDAVLLTHLGSDNLFGISSVLQRKSNENVHPEVGYVYYNAVENAKSNNGPDGLLVNVLNEANKIVDNMKTIGHSPTACTRTNGPAITPINLYHKVGQGCLDMYILNPVQDTKELKDFLAQWNKNVRNFSSVKLPQQIPLPEALSVCALLVWKPACPSESVTRIFFPGNAPQQKIFEGLDKLKTLEFLKHPTFCDNDLLAKRKGSATGKPAAKAASKPRPAAAATEKKAPSKSPSPPKAATPVKEPAKKPAVPKTTGTEKKKVKSSVSSASSEPKSSPSVTPSDTPVSPIPKEPSPIPETKEPAAPVNTANLIDTEPPKVESKPEPEPLVPDVVPPEPKKEEPAPLVEPSVPTQSLIDVSPQGEPAPLTPNEDKPLIPEVAPEPVKQEPITPEQASPAEHPVEEPELISIEPAKVEPAAPKADVPEPAAAWEEPPKPAPEPVAAPVQPEVAAPVESAPAPEEPAKESVPEPPTELLLETPEALPDPAQIDLDGVEPKPVEMPVLEKEMPGAENEMQVENDVPQVEQGLPEIEQDVPEAEKEMPELEKHELEVTSEDMKEYKEKLAEMGIYDDQDSGCPKNSLEEMGASDEPEVTPDSPDYPFITPQQSMVRDSVDVPEPLPREEPVSKIPDQFEHQRPDDLPAQPEEQMPAPPDAVSATADLSPEQTEDLQNANFSPQEPVGVEPVPMDKNDLEAQGIYFDDDDQANGNTEEKPDLIQEVEPEEPTHSRESSVPSSAPSDSLSRETPDTEIEMTGEKEEDEEPVEPVEPDQPVSDGPTPTEPDAPAPDLIQVDSSHTAPVDDLLGDFNAPQDNVDQSPLDDPTCNTTQPSSQPMLLDNYGASSDPFSENSDPHTPHSDPQTPFSDVPTPQSDVPSPSSNPFTDDMPCDSVSSNPFLGMDGTEPFHQPADPQPTNPFDGMTDQAFEGTAGGQPDLAPFDPVHWGEPMGLPSPPPPEEVTVNSVANDKAAEPKTGAKKTTTKKAADSNKSRTAEAKRGDKDDKKSPVSPTKPLKKSSPAPSGGKPTANGKATKDNKENKDVTKRPTSGAAKKPRPVSAPPAKADPPTKKAAPSSKPASARTRPTSSAASKAPAAKPLAPVVPVYVDLTYVPHHGNPSYCDVDFFRRVRARYYVISSLNPPPQVFSALLEAKQTWEDSNLEVTIIPTYDNDTLRHWMGLNRDQLNDLKIDVAPSASRCTIQLQDHETSCAAYRLEF